ncbi:putative sterile alpha motif containing protein [Lyophyllum shimeji]|uniref:RNA-binding protein VTS1 n=1 Tax=Lyophyllum shimeji TaxID=47721 RepID=A0A9P3PLL6_LYOSH|nr:putative sterile alpha motif containing protein [Lyophyllum shimeji]
MSLRPPSTPSPGPNENGKANSRQSLGPSARGTPGLAPASPRPGAGAGSGARPTSELLGGGNSGMFQTPEAEALDQWFENLQNYEATLEDMAAASLDVNFKEELSAIEQWFKVLSEAERTAALYSLLQHSTQVQIRFFITVLQQMARSDPMTALLSPAMGGSMQSQMEAKLASLKSPGLKSGLPASPTTRNFTPGNRSSLALDNSSNFLSPESAANPTGNDAAATLAQQRAKLKASNAAHRISAPVLSAGNVDGRPTWAAGPQLSQVSEQNASAQEIVVNASRPKSTEFSGSLSPRPGAIGGGEATVPSGDSWASMVNTPLIPMFKNDTRNQTLDAAANKLNEWSTKNAAPGVPRMGDPTIHRRAKPAANDNRDHNNNNGAANSMYDDNGNLIGQHQNQQGRGGPRNVSGNSNNNFGGPGGWSGARSPALSNASSNRFGGDDSGNNLNGMNGLGMPMPIGMGSPTLGMGMPGLAGMAPMNPFNMNMLMGMGLTPEAQLLAAQMAASGFGQPGWLGMQPMSAGVNSRRGPPSGRSPGLKSASSTGSRADGGTPKAEDDVDPALLNDIPAWLRSLRLHKYTPNFEGCKWQDMVMMDEAALEAKGVAALGARRKMLKTFELVRKKMGMEPEGPPSSVPSASAPLKSA